MKSPYASPVMISSYPTLAIGSLIMGIVLMAMYFVYQMKSSASENPGRKFFVELLIGASASVFLGAGCFFLCLVFDLWA